MIWNYVCIALSIIISFLCGMLMRGNIDYRQESVGELIIGEKNSEDWPYLSLSLDEEVEDFAGEEYVVLKVNKLDLSQK